MPLPAAIAAQLARALTAERVGKTAAGGATLGFMADRFNQTPRQVPGVDQILQRRAQTNIRDQELARRQQALQAIQQQGLPNPLTGELGGEQNRAALLNALQGARGVPNPSQLPQASRELGRAIPRAAPEQFFNEEQIRRFNEQIRGIPSDAFGDDDQ